MPMKPQGKVKCKWSSKMAYAVGLLVTDGSLSKDGRHINFTSKDIDLIETFKKCLGLRNTTGKKMGGYSTSPSLQVQFGDVLFYKWLVALGLFPNKSKTIGELKIPNKYFFDFFRGCFDGDGSIFSYWDPRWHSSYMFYINIASGSMVFLKWLQKTISDFCNISGHIKPSNGCHLLSFAKKDSRILLNKMYYKKNLPYLKRKFSKAKKILHTDHQHDPAQVAELAYA